MGKITKKKKDFKLDNVSGDFTNTQTLKKIKPYELIKTADRSRARPPKQKYKIRRLI